MSTVSVRMNENLVNTGRMTAKAGLCSVHDQVEFWTRWHAFRLITPNCRYHSLTIAEPSEESSAFVPPSLGM